MVNNDFIREALRQHWQFHGQKESYINAIADECEKQNAFDYASIKRVVKSMIDSGRLPEAEGYREVFDFFWSKHSDFAGVQGNENILVQDLQSRGARFTVQGLEDAFQRLIQQNPNTFQHNRKWYDQQAQAAGERYERKKLTAQGREAAALEAELLAAKKEELNKGRVKLSNPTMGESFWAEKAEQRIAEALEKENARLTGLSVEELQAEKAQLDAKREQEKVSKQYVPGSHPTPSQYKPLPPDYHGEPWTMRLLSRLGGIGAGQENNLRRVIRQWGADAINQAVRENAQKGIV